MFKWFMAVSFIGISVSADAGHGELAKFLNSMTLGNNSFYNRALSPAKSLNMNLSEADRTLEINLKVAAEMDAVLAAFKSAAEENKVAAVYAQASKSDPELIRQNGAHIQFYNDGPSAAFSRVLMMVEKNPANAGLSAEALLNSFSSYKRSAIPSTYIYEYSEPENLGQSSLKATTGTDLTWKRPHAAAPIKADQDLVLKKCRQIFGWKCVTSLYRTGQLLIGKDSLKYFYAGIYNLISNSDHPDFISDKRSTNQITGSTALYIVKESRNWIMLYGIDSQWNQGTIMFTPLISEEFAKDTKRIKERLTLDLKIAPTGIK